MSFTTLCLSVIALSPELSASLISGLLAAVPVVAGMTDRQTREAVLVEEMNKLAPRDLEEAILASQFLAAHHNAQACYSALDGLDPASKEASRLRRDTMAMQRVVIAMHRALQKSQARPMQEDAAGGEPRPTVPVKLPSPRRGKAAGQENPPVAAGVAAADSADATVAAEASEQFDPFAKFDPFKADPSLARLREKWSTLKRWEDMTMEERRETFGYKYEPKPSDGSNGNGATGAGTTEVARTAA